MAGGHETRTDVAHRFVSDRRSQLDESEIIGTIRRRYHDPNFSRARFLVCIGDDYGRENFARFALRLRKIANTRTAARDVDQKVSVRVSRKEFIPEVTFHLQQEEGVDRAVAELRLPGLTVGATPVPRHYLVTSVRSVRTLLGAYFEQEWAAARAVDLAALLGLDEADTVQGAQAKTGDRTRR